MHYNEHNMKTTNTLDTTSKPIKRVETGIPRPFKGAVKLGWHLEEIVRGFFLKGENVHGGVIINGGKCSEEYSGNCPGWVL